MMDRASQCVRVGIIGCGYFGQLHAKKYANLPQAELVAVTDTDPSAAASLADRLHVDAVADASDLIDRVDAVSVVVPTADHFAVAAPLLEAGLHVLVEKPIAATTAQARELIELAASNGGLLQVGHLERFNAAILALKDVINQPKFVEVYRIAPFKPRGTDVDVILDLMIHDIDLIQYLVDTPLEAVDAVGVPVLSERDDIANARLRFEGGCVASVTASRAGLKRERKMRLFQRDAYISIDFHASSAVIARRSTDETNPDTPKIDLDQRRFEANDPLAREIDAFIDAVRGRRPVEVPGLDGLRALETAIEITRAMQRPDDI